MLLSAVSVLVVAQSSSEIPGGLMNNPVQLGHRKKNWENKGHRNKEDHQNIRKNKPASFRKENI